MRRAKSSAAFARKPEGNTRRKILLQYSLFSLPCIRLLSANSTTATRNPRRFWSRCAASLCKNAAVTMPHGVRAESQSASMISGRKDTTKNTAMFAIVKSAAARARGRKPERASVKSDIPR